MIHLEGEAGCCPAYVLVLRLTCLMIPLSMRIILFCQCFVVLFGVFLCPKHAMNLAKTTCSSPEHMCSAS